MIMLSDRAAIEMGRIISEQNLGEVYIRVGVKGGGCSGFSYTLGFDEDKNCLLYTSPSPRDGLLSRMPSSA